MATTPHNGAAGSITGGPDKRFRRTRAELEALDARIVAILAADNPQSVRHVFYRLTDPTGPVSVPKSEHGYDCIVRRCTALRRSGRVPYYWLTDATRRGYHADSFASGGDLIEQFASLYRVSLWADTDRYVEVWCESRSIAGVIEDDCRRLGVSLYPCGGFASLSLTFQGSEDIRRAADGRDVVIVYIGDWDPAGVLIPQKVLAELHGHLPDLSIFMRRIAVTRERAAGLPSKPRKAGDRRRLDIRTTVEAEAIPAAELRALLRQTVEGYLPAGALASAQAAEASEREGLQRLGALVSEFGTDEAVDVLTGRST